MRLQRRLLLASLGTLGIAASATGWWWRHQRPHAALRASLLVAGANAMLDLNRALATEFARTRPMVDVAVEQGGSLAGLIALQRGAIDVAAMSRELSEAEDSPRTRSYLVAKNDIAIAVHPQSPLRNLSAEQVRAIFMGEITEWQTVGGPAAPIRVVSRAPGSSSRQFLQELVLQGEDFTLQALEVGSAKEMAKEIAADPLAIGYVALKDRDATPLTYLSIDGVPATRTTVLSARYRFTQPLYLVVYGDVGPTAQAFIDFALGAEGQAIVASQHLFPVA
jgi:phosphate transport system substrate-binding protein